ncbi:MAG: lectin like domain-containing protein, partial [Candidatus Saccharicenans sp.]
GSCGSCWAFATYGSLESFLMPNEIRDFSEQDLIDHHGYDYGPCDGGNLNMSAAYLARWTGPLREEDDPYIYAQAGAIKHVQQIIMIPPRSDSSDNDQIKQAVMDYGAVYTTMFWDSSCYNSTYRSYYNASSQVGGHAVAIVGWNDNFEASKFNTPPPGNGAFIVKNSWGASWGENGYFYVSYYDNYFGRRGFNAVVKAENSSNYQVIYQYDPLGWVTSFGYGSTTAWMANIFQATSDLPIKAVSFYVPALNSSYEIYIYRNVAPNQPKAGELATSKTGVIASPGYYTIILDTAVAVSIGQYFSVVLKLTTPGYNYPISAEGTYAGYSSQAVPNPQLSLVSSDGSSWFDLGTYGYDVCLKAFAGLAALYPPLNLNVAVLENNFIFFKEYINRLTWSANPENITRIVNHKIYRKAATEQKYNLVATVGGSDYQYDDRGLKNPGTYSYQVTVVDEMGRESDPATILRSKYSITRDSHSVPKPDRIAIKKIR